MNLQTFLDSITQVLLSHKQIKAVQIGNVFDIGVSKKQQYPCVWIELPILADYSDNIKKTYTFALNFLTTSKEDDNQSAVKGISDMDEVADECMQALDDIEQMNWDNITGLTLKSFSDDDLCGIRIEFTAFMRRVCDYQQAFDKPIEL